MRRIFLSAFFIYTAIILTFSADANYDRYTKWNNDSIQRYQVPITPETEDYAYEAPKSKLVGEWATPYDSTFIFNANGTGTWISYGNSVVVEEIYFFQIFNFKWTKEGNYIKIVGTGKMLLDPECKEAYDALSARRKKIVEDKIAFENSLFKSNFKFELEIGYIGDKSMYANTMLDNSVIGKKWWLKVGTPPSTTNNSQAKKKTSTPSKKKSRKK